MRTILAAAFLFCSIPKAQALQKISGEDYRDIAAQLAKMRTAEDDIQMNNEARRGATAEEIVELDRNLVRLKRERKAAYEQAMWRTIKAAEIIPIVDNDPVLPTGVSVEKSKHIGQRVKWVPIFDEIGVKQRQDGSGARAAPKEFTEKNAGNTASDGVSRIFPGAFENPSALASYIVHEVRHFWQMVTPGKGDGMTAAELEVEAYDEELRLLNDPDNPLGYTVETRRDQAARLTELLDGDGKGKSGFRKTAKKERAEADKKRGGRPLPGLSIVSFSTAEIDGLVEQAKGQIVIAQRDHDDRLRRAILALTRRSCANPGSVTQSELDGLAKPHHRDFLNQDALPLDKRKCFEVYFYVGRGGRDADEVRRMSAPTLVPLDPRIPRPIPAQPVPATLFAKMLPSLKDFAITACRTPAQAAPVLLNLDGAFYKSLSGRAAQNDSDVAYHRIGLTGCSDKLFYLLTVMVRDGTYWKVGSRDWIRDTVASFSGGPGRAPDQAPPLQGVVPPPDQKHPDIVIPKLPWQKNIVDIKKTKHEN